MSVEQGVVRVTRTFAAPRSVVYRAWLDPELVRRWLAPPGEQVTHVEVDERVGGRHRVVQGHGGGFDSEIVELVPDRRIVLRCGLVGPDGPVHDSLLTVELRDAAAGGTDLVLVHERLDALRRARPEVADLVGVGWSMTLERLDAVVEVPTLFVCHGDDEGPRFHPCRRVQEALRTAGIEYERVIGGQGHPLPWRRRGARDELLRRTGDTKLPALLLPDGTALTHSGAILDWTRAQAAS